MNENEQLEFDPHAIDHGSASKKMSWSAFKGHIRGIVRGLIVGCTIGAVVGLGVWGLGAIGLIGALTATAAQTAAVFSVTAGVLASSLMGRIGNAAGNAAGQLAEQELRLRYPELPELSPDAPQPGYGHHLEIPADRDKGKFFHPRVGIAGAIMGGLFGGIASIAGLGSIIAMHTTAVVALPVLAPVILGAVMGSSFGVNRSVFKTIFNFTDNLMHGKVGGPTQDDLAKNRELYRLQGDPGPEPVITNLQRQEEFYRLENGYFKKAFEAGFAGNGRGLLGGLVIGGGMGILLGGVAVGALALFGGFAITGAGAMAIIAGISAFTMHKSADFFSEAMFEGSSHDHVHEVYHERVRSLRKGENISFDQAEMNIVERRQSDPELTPAASQSKDAFKPRVALVLGAVGAAIGVGLTPVIGPIAGALGISAGKISLGLSASTFGMAGASFGIGPKITEKLHSLSDAIFHGAFNPGVDHPDIKVEGRIPLMSPNSDLAEHFSVHLKKSIPQIDSNRDVSAIYKAPAEPQSTVQSETPLVTPEVKPERKPAFTDIINKGARNLEQQVSQSIAAPSGLDR